MSDGWGKGQPSSLFPGPPFRAASRLFLGPPPASCLFPVSSRGQPPATLTSPLSSEADPQVFGNRAAEKQP